jgi:hypothetical protein
MRVISTVLCLFAAIIMMATPLMACCVTGHTDSVPVSVQSAATNAPPCHNVEKVVSGSNDAQTPEKYCASCDDCAMSPAFTVDLDPIVKTHVDMTFVALLNAPQALPRPEMRLLRITGPPLRQDLQRADSPLARFDALLI